MQAYKSWEFCESIGCYALELSKENRLWGHCCYCKAYQFHEYLQERGLIVDEKLAEELYLLRERVGMKEDSESYPACEYKPDIWIDGAPPDFTGQDKVWIIAEIPSRWLDTSGYRCFFWLDPEGWTDKEVMRAKRWKLLFKEE